MSDSKLTITKSLIINKSEGLLKCSNFYLPCYNFIYSPALNIIRLKYCH